MAKKSEIKEKGTGQDSQKKNSGLCEEIELIDGIVASMENGTLTLRKDDKEISREINGLVSIKIEENKIFTKCRKSRKIEKRVFGTTNAHIRNMIKGLTEGFRYKLAIANVHFPMNVSFDKNTNSVVVKNFLGEKKDRVIKLVEGPEVKIGRGEIEIIHHDIEKAGDCATKIEKGTRVRNRDRRIYQDGIFIIEKPGRKYL